MAAFRLGNTVTVYRVHGQVIVDYQGHDGTLWNLAEGYNAGGRAVVFDLASGDEVLHLGGPVPILSDRVYTPVPDND